MLTKTLTVALVGNPNAGKSTLFNALSGLRQRVGNYPGVTVEMKKGRYTAPGGVPVALIDLPGTYSLAARSPDEMVAVDVLLGRRPEEPRPDVVVSVVDATNLDRHLYLTSQLLDLGEPVVVAVTMVDAAEAQGIRVDCGRLAEVLGVPVVPVRANQGVGLDALTAAVVSAAESDEYYVRRPLGSRLGAWASPQSAVIPDRAYLEARHAELTAEYPGGDPPRPANWGGYRILPQVIEFWQGRPSRLHDRLRFARRPDGSWARDRLAP